jgi:hypothetical protein
VPRLAASRAALLPTGDLGKTGRIQHPYWVLGVVVLAWGATSTAATWVASRIGGQPADIVVALLLAWALIFNLTMLPYATWFKTAMFIAFPIACLLGIRYGRRVPYSHRGI